MRIIEEAIDRAGSKAQLARELGVSRQFIAQMAAGDAPIPAWIEGRIRAGQPSVGDAALSASRSLPAIERWRAEADLPWAAISQGSPYDVATLLMGELKDRPMKDADAVCVGIEASRIIAHGICVGPMTDLMEKLNGRILGKGE
jgi:hypothetical protein